LETENVVVVLVLVAGAVSVPQPRILRMYPNDIVDSEQENYYLCLQNERSKVAVAVLMMPKMISSIISCRITMIFVVIVKTSTKIVSISCIASWLNI